MVCGWKGTVAKGEGVFGVVGVAKEARMYRRCTVLSPCDRDEYVFFLKHPKSVSLKWIFIKSTEFLSYILFVYVKPLFLTLYKPKKLKQNEKTVYIIICPGIIFDRRF